MTFTPPIRIDRTLLLVRGTTSGKTSDNATFRVTGTAIGTKSIVSWRAGANAHIYSMTLTSSTSAKTHAKHSSDRLHPVGRSQKKVKQYVFSGEDAREYEHRLKVLRTQIDRTAANALESE